MSTQEVKKKLHELINSEEDNATLQAIYHLLSKAQHDSQMRTALTLRAERSEQDIDAGRVSDVDTVYARLRAKRK